MAGREKLGPQLFQIPHEVLVLLEGKCERKFLMTLLSLLRKAFFVGMMGNDIETLKPWSLGSATFKYFVG